MAQLFDEMDQLLAESRPGAPGMVTDSNVASDVATLRTLVEQQTDVLSALVNALTGDNTAPGEQPAEDTDDVVDAFFERVERLQRQTDGAD